MKNITTKNHRMILTIIFAAICAAVVGHHEIWRDTANSWLMARESASLSELLSNIRYKGHPYLWEILLFPVSWISSRPEAAQIFTLMIAVLTVWIFLRHAPFGILPKTLFIFGFFPLYEYAVVARPYGLSLFFLFVFCALFQKRHGRFLTISFVVVLLANSNTIGFIIAAACAGILLVDAVFAGGFKNPNVRQWGGILMMICGITVSFLTILPGVESRLFKSDFVSIFKNSGGKSSEAPGHSPPSLKKVAADFNLEKTTRTYSSAFFPIPEHHLKILLGNNNKNFTEALKRFRTPLFLLAAFLTFLVMRIIAKSRPALLFWIFATVGLAFLFTFIFSGSLRHHGFFFIVLVAALWLARANGKNPRQPSKFFNIALTIILALQVAGGAAAIFADYHFPFSNGKKTAQFIQREIPADMPIFAWPAADVVSAYRHKGNKIFSPEYHRGAGREASFYDFHPTTLARKELTFKSALDRARKFADEKNQAVLLIFLRAPNERLIKKYRLSEVVKFTGAIMPAEDYYLYLMPAPNGKIGQTIK